MPGLAPCSWLPGCSNGVAWGCGDYGGDISGVKEELEQGIEQIWSTHGAFLAQLKSGAVMAWGRAREPN